MTDRVRVLRVLEYEGSRKWVEECINLRTVKGEMCIIAGTNAGAVIREAIIGEVPVVLDAQEGKAKPANARKPSEAIRKPECRWPSCEWPDCIVAKDTGLHTGRRCFYKK